MPAGNRSVNGQVDEVVSPGSAVTVSLLSQGQGDIQTVHAHEHGSAVTVSGYPGVVVALNGVNIVVAHIHGVEFVAVDYCGNSILFLNAGVLEEVHACDCQTGNQDNCDHCDKNGGISFQFLGFFLSLQLLLGQLSSCFFLTKLLFCGCAHVIISSHKYAWPASKFEADQCIITDCFLSFKCFCIVDSRKHKKFTVICGEI